jgi:VanZ family protein
MANLHQPGSEPRPLFTSVQERRLWLWALAAVIAIWSTLGLAGSIADMLRDRRILEVTFFYAFLALLAVIACAAVLRRPGPREFFAGLGVAAVYLMAALRLGNVERTHLFEYGLVSVLIYHALCERRRGGREVPMPAVVAILAAAFLGFLDEGIQSLLPNRVYDLIDVGFNALAATMTVVATLVLAWARRLDVLGGQRRSS